MKTKFFRIYLKGEDVELPDKYDVWRNMTPAEVLVDIAKEREINKRAQETLLFIGWGGDGKICAISEMFIGTSSAMVTTVKELFQAALLSNAISIATLHNHPSGEAVPSAQDIKQCRKATEAGKLLDIHLIEDVVIDFDGNYASTFQAMLKEDLKG